MDNLFEKLWEYGKEDFYPFHMPGHKRSTQYTKTKLWYGIDITEIEGFDNLHRPQGIIKQEQEFVKKLYGADESYFLVNGSTAGILAAVSAAVPRNGQVLAARNCHKAVYHALYIRNLTATYIYPDYVGEECLNGSISPEKVSAALAGNKEIGAVILTSPTYDGIASDIKAIAEIVHEYGIPLIVDEAHGAHFKWSEGFPRSAVDCGADIVIHSIHKTLPSMTQTAVLHKIGNRVDTSLLTRFLSVYQTSSPSYVLMSSITDCFHRLADEGGRLFEEYHTHLENFIRETKTLKHLRILDKDWMNANNVFAYDESKILISTLGTNISGRQLYDRLRENYRLQLEMPAVHYVLGMTSIMDTRQGFDRLVQALSEIDGTLKFVQSDVKEQNYMYSDIKIQNHVQSKDKAQNCIYSDAKTQNYTQQDPQPSPSPQQARITLAEALETPHETKNLEQCENEVAGEFIYLYPPGIPVIVPGEVFTGAIIEEIKRYKALGLSLQGPADYTMKTTKILKSERTLR